MGILALLGFWEKVKHTPSWLEKSSQKYISNFSKKYGHPPYGQIKYFKGQNYKYRINYKIVAQGQFEEIIHKKKK